MPRWRRWPLFLEATGVNVSVHCSCCRALSVCSPCCCRHASPALPQRYAGSPAVRTRCVPVPATPSASDWARLRSSAARGCRVFSLFVRADLFHGLKRRTIARETPKDSFSRSVKSALALTSEALKNIEHRQNTSFTVRPSVASRLIRGFELLNTLPNNFNGNQSEDSAQKRCA